MMNQCDRHNMKRDGLFCLNDECDDRLECIECWNDKHRDHKYIMINEFMMNSESEMNRILNRTYDEVMKQNGNSE